MLGLMIAILLLMAYTPLGYLNIGPLAITFNVIPVAISAIVLWDLQAELLQGQCLVLTSCLQCIGVGGSSAMGATLICHKSCIGYLFRDLYQDCWMVFFLDIFSEAPVRNPRMFTFLAAVTGFFSAFLNTLFFHDNAGCPFWQHVSMYRD